MGGSVSGSVETANNSLYLLGRTWSAAGDITANTLTLGITNVGGTTPIKTFSIVTNSQNANNTTYELARISRDIVNWSINSLEITVNNLYYRGGMSRWVVTYNQVNAGTVELIAQAGTIPHKLYLGNEVTVAGDIRYRPILIDLPQYTIANIEMKYKYAEVASINASSQLQFTGIYTTNASATGTASTITSITANNSAFAYGKQESQLSVASAVSATSATTATTAGSATTANNATYAYGKQESQLSVASAAFATSAGSVSGSVASATTATFLNSAASSTEKNDITTRTNSGFWETATGTTAEGWPINNGGYQHLLATTHLNGANYYSMQLGADFYTNALYYRSTNGSGTTAWSRIPLYGSNFAGDLYASRFYDADNTAYYVDPASLAYLYHLEINGANHKYLYINPGNGHEAMVRYNGGAGSGWYVGKRTTTSLVDTTSFHFYSEAAAATVGGIDSSGNILASGSMRAPIFYDNNDTAYYFDGNNLSKVNQITRRNTRVNVAREYPLGHYTPGETVFEVDPTWSETELRNYFGSNSVSWVADATAPGGYAISISGGVDVGGTAGGAAGFPFIPVDQDDIFYMEIWIKDVTGTNRHYLGSNEYNESFTDLGGNPGSYGYWVMQNSAPGTSWTKYSGYITGFGNTVGQFESGTKYFTPMALFNYATGGVSRISGWKIIKVSQQGNRTITGRTGSIQDNSTYALDVFHPTSYRQLRVRSSGDPMVKFSGSYNSGNGAEIWQGSSGTLNVNINSGMSAFTTTTAGSTTFSGDARAPIFYDSNDTNYYIDPSSTADNALRMRGGAHFGPNVTWGASLYVGGNGRVGTAASVAVTNGNLHIDCQNGFATYLNWYSENNIWSKGNFGVGSDSASHRLHVHGTGLATSDFRAPIFYDTNNTVYYTDPASVSNINSLLTQAAVSNNVNGLRNIHPGGGTYVTGSSSVSGAIKIKLPETVFPMLRFTVRVYTYDGLSFDIYCGGHTSSGLWYNTFAYMTTANRSALNVRFTYDGVNMYVMIGELASTWAYPQVFITDVQVGYTNYEYTRWDDGWVISFDAATYHTVGSTHTVFPPTSSTSRVATAYSSVFTDSNDTAYYVDPNSYSNIWRLNCASTFASDTGGSSLYIGSQNVSTANSLWINFHSDGDTNYRIGKPAGAWTQPLEIRFFTGIRHRAHRDYGGHQFIDFNDNGLKFSVANGDGNVRSLTNFYAPIMYDIDNAAYYVDPGNGSNVLGEFRVTQNGAAGIQLISTTGTQSLWIRTGYSGAPTPSVSATNVQFQSSGSSAGTFSFWSGNTLSLTIAGDYAQGAGSLRAPIFYDSDNTGFFWNPNTSAAHRLQTPSGYLDLGPMNTGFCHFQTDRGQFYFGQDIHADGIYYDYDNTGYYVDPASTTNLNILNVVGGNVVKGDGSQGRSTSSSNMNSLTDPSGFYYYDNATGAPTAEWYNWINCIGNAWGSPDRYGFQIAHKFWDENGVYIRRVQSGNWNTWRRLFHEGSVDVRSPIFYDINDTAYFTNMAGRRDTNINGFTARTKMTLGLTSKYQLDRADFTGDTNYWIGSMGWGTTDMNVVADWGSGFIDSWSNPANQPSGTSHWVGTQAFHLTVGAGSAYGWQLVGGPVGNLRFRNAWNTWSGWVTVAMHDRNDGSGGPLYAGLYYDSNDTGRFMDPNSTSFWNTSQQNGWHYFNQNYGHGVVGLYASTRFQCVYAMGDAYKGNADGTSLSGAYGLWWSYPSAGGPAASLGSHGLMCIVNGTNVAQLDTSTQANGDMRAPIFYDRNDTAWYTNPNSDSNLNTLRIRASGISLGSGNSRQLEINNAASGACNISFHREGAYGAHFGLDTDNWFSTFGWSAGGGYTNMRVGIMKANVYERYSHNSGHLRGGYNNIGASEGQSSPIYTIGSSYEPAATTLSNMYGIGFTAGGSFFPSGASGWGLYVADNGVARVFLSGGNGEITATGNITAYASDRRLKTNITPITNAVDKLMQINGVEFDWVDNIQDIGFIPQQMHETGVIAQEIQAVIPDAVKTAPFNKNATDIAGFDSDYLTVDKEKIVPLLIEAIKEQQAHINRLEEKINLLIDNK